MKRILIVITVLLIALSARGQSVGVRFGVDVTADCFLPMNSRVLPSFGLGVRARLGERDQWLNLVSGLRYIYGRRLSGFQIPIVLNVNLLRTERVSGYVGGGYEFDFIATYWGCAKAQAGLAFRNIDARVFYKPYQGDLGLGITYYF